MSPYREPRAFERSRDRSSIPTGVTIVAALSLVLAACETQPEASPPAAPKPPIAEGQPAPGFTLESSSGETMSLEDFTGARPVLFYFSMGPG